MKKSLSVILAVVISLFTVLVVSFSAMAEEPVGAVADAANNATSETEPTKKSAHEEDASKEAASKEAASKEAAEKASKEAAEKASKEAAEKASKEAASKESSSSKAEASTSDTAEIVTGDKDKTYIDEGSTKTTTTKAAKKENNIPNTGSSVVVPAVAFLALAAGTVAVVKSKKEI